MKKVFVVIAAVAVSGAMFYGGMVYGQSTSASNSFARGGNFAGGSMMNRGGNGTRQFSGGMRGNGVEGQVIKKDDKSITVQLPNGGSKIVFYSDTTQVMKSQAVALSDVKEGETVSVNGTTNSDGSVTAKNIQIRPAVKADASAPAANPAVQK